MEILINFGGYYDSMHSDNIDWKIENEWEWEFEEAGEAAAPSLAQWHDKVNWESTYNSYGEAYINRLNNHFDLELEFRAIHSPKYYNFTTDKLVVYVPDVDEQRLYDYAGDPDFNEWANPLLTSRDGFHSFYNGITDLAIRAEREKQAHEILIGMIVDYLISRDSINEEIYDLNYEIIYND